ncbi:MULTISPECIES: SIS domain-containing protein [unclassified Desulfovibrio]|uniref:SIS domain-containing protein n=1 Tax=unclassified Desulfovibrio TaxID=2593640 RepID=UPI000F5FBE28|nr:MULTISPECIES: SIS domain-containing protein [unclassified Desulfovibrio]RRD69596.1 SIS domain-containing protein [Desulfovibrio sp. OH1209_COT-279]RRD86256.1 SIS domain-containing protein [Desulfovibrio sp. OH1186_COT-070]
MSDAGLSLIEKHLSDSAHVQRAFFQRQGQKLCSVALRMAACLATEGKLLLCGYGNGGILAQCLASEFVARQTVDHPPLPVIALMADTAASGTEAKKAGQALCRQVAVFGRKGDMLLAFLPSGSNAGIAAALQTARQKGMGTVGLTSEDDTAVATHCDTVLEVPDVGTSLVQEVHVAAGHLLYRLTDYYLFENAAVLLNHLRNPHEKRIDDAHL